MSHGMSSSPAETQNLNIYDVDEDKVTEFYQSFGTTVQMVNKDVEIIKEWLQTQIHLPEIMDDVKIKNFLTLSKFSIENTKQKIDMYYTIRSVIPDLFDSSNPKLPHMKLFRDLTYCCTHPKAVNGIHRVYFLKAKAPNTYNAHHAMMQLFDIFEMRLYEDCLIDDYFIFDLENITFSDMNNITPSLVAKSVAVYKKVYSLRLKKIYFINAPPYVSMLLSILKVVLKPKIYNRLQVDQKAEVLKEVFTDDTLPKDYGGEGPSLEEMNEMTVQKLAQYQERFDLLDTLRVNENLRPEKLDNDEILGFYGNFKKLDVD
ncbi:hypothetical protein MTP99_005732 [Tenebrio molitor]|nr:hypothetical protein MTP99_005732 [Tenebrio molitor]